VGNTGDEGKVCVGWRVMDESCHIKQGFIRRVGDRDKSLSDTGNSAPAIGNAGLVGIDVAYLLLAGEKYNNRDDLNNLLVWRVTW